MLSNRRFNDRLRQLILAMITSAGHAPWLSDTAIQDLNVAGLATASIVRLKLFALDRDLVLKPIGKLSEIDRRGVARSLNQAVL